MAEKGLPPSSGAQTSVFSVFQGIGDRYSQFEEDTLLSTSPPIHDNFPEPIKFKPRKSKFHQETKKNNSGESSNLSITDKSFPKLIITNKPSQISGEVLKQQFTANFGNQRRVLDSSSPHGSIETAPSHSAAVKLFERTHQLRTGGPVLSMVRRSSDSNLIRTYGQDGQTSTALVKNSDLSLAVKETETKRIDKPERESIKTDFSIDSTDSSQSSLSSFTGWLYGGQKVVNVENRDMNAIGPTSF